jgi:hypothetical protein
MLGEQRTIYTSACRNCGWIGSDGSRPEAEAEGAKHERGERQAWQMKPGEKPGWKGDRGAGLPTSRGSLANPMRRWECRGVSSFQSNFSEGSP